MVMDWAERLYDFRGVVDAKPHFPVCGGNHDQTCAHQPSDARKNI